MSRTKNTVMENLNGTMEDPTKGFGRMVNNTEKVHSLIKMDSKFKRSGKKEKELRAPTLKSKNNDNFPKIFSSYSNTL